MKKKLFIGVADMDGKATCGNDYNLENKETENSIVDFNSLLSGFYKDVNDITPVVEITILIKIPHLMPRLMKQWEKQITRHFKIIFIEDAVAIAAFAFGNKYNMTARELEQRELLLKQ